MSKKAKAEAFVLDGSVTLAWYFKDEAHPYANAVAGRFPTAQAIVPAIWPLEVANAVLVGEGRKRSSAYDAAYLELALRRSLPLATLDNKLKAAATAVGIAEYNPS